jgi:hypothetical protein
MTLEQSATNHYQQQFHPTNNAKQKFLSSTFKTKPSSSSGRDIIKYPTCSNTCPLCATKSSHDMKIKILLVLTLLLTLGKISIAQSLVGVWKGTSLCQIKNSPCHDENVVYHISKNSSGDSYQIDASKIIDGKENDMGTLNFSFNAQQKILFLVDSVKNVKWEFKISGKEMHGTLISKGTLSRIIDLKKEDSIK